MSSKFSQITLEQTTKDGNNAFLLESFQLYIIHKCVVCDVAKSYHHSESLVGLRTQHKLENSTCAVYTEREQSVTDATLKIIL